MFDRKRQLMKTEPPAIQLLALSKQVYYALLVLYPADFRREYGQHMAQIFGDVCRDAYCQGGAWALAYWWVAALFDLLQTVISEHRKVISTMSQARFIQWSGWLCILGGIFFTASSTSQLLVGSQTYQLSIAALIPGMALIVLGMVGIFLRYNAHLNLFGKLSLLATLIGAGMAAIGWLLTLAVANTFWNMFIGGLLLYLAGHTVFGGFAATTHLLPKWNYALLIGSALPLTLVMLGFSNQRGLSGASWGLFVMLLLIGIAWMLTGWALNSKPTTASSPPVISA